MHKGERKVQSFVKKQITSNGVTDSKCHRDISDFDVYVRTHNLQAFPVPFFFFDCLVRSACGIVCFRPGESMFYCIFRINLICKVILKEIS